MQKIVGIIPGNILVLKKHDDNKEWIFYDNEEKQLLDFWNKQRELFPDSLFSVSKPMLFFYEGDNKL